MKHKTKSWKVRQTHTDYLARGQARPFLFMNWLLDLLLYYTSKVVDISVIHIVCLMYELQYKLNRKLIYSDCFDKSLLMDNWMVVKQ